MRNISVVYVHAESLNVLFASHSLTEELIWQRVLRYTVVIWQAVIPPCLCAVSLLILYLLFTHAHPVRGTYNNHSFHTTDRQPSLLHIRRENHRCGIPKFKLCWASCMFSLCILHCTPPTSFFWQTLSWGPVRLINVFWAETTAWISVMSHP